MEWLLKWGMGEATFTIYLFFYFESSMVSVCLFPLAAFYCFGYPAQNREQNEYG